MINNQNGRTMVEMIGVLAIAGIISVVGLLGFSVAIRKMRANEIAEIVSDLLITAKTYRGEKKCIDQDYLDDGVKIPHCVTELKASTESDIAKIEFKDNSSCAKIAKLVGDSFGPCKWKKGSGDTYYVMPSVGSEEKNGHINCDDRPNWPGC